MSKQLGYSTQIQGGGEYREKMQTK